MSHRFQYVIDNGLNTDEEYPYVGSFFNVTCKAKSPYVVKVKEAVVVDATESALKDAVGTYDLAIILRFWCNNNIDVMILLVSFST